MSDFGYPLYPVPPANQQAVSQIVGTSTLGAGAATYDKNFIITGAGGYTITLPALDGVNFPSRTFSIFNNSSSTCTVNTAGTDTALLLGGSYTSISILPGERFLVQNMVTSWVIALESASRTTTAPQFDNTIRTASTAFVQRSLGNFQSLNTRGTITAADMGKAFYYSPQGVSVQLPAPASVPSGSSVKLMFSSTGTITVADGSSMIFGSYSVVGKSNTGTSLAINGGEVTAVSDGASIWYVMGSAAPAFIGGFSSNPISSGFQQFPSGLIVQWGGGQLSGTTGTVTYPMTFPTAVFKVVVTSNTPANTAIVSYTSSTTSVLTVTSNGSSNPSYSFIALGN